MLTQDQLYKALVMLGDSHKKVADRLLELECFGHRLSMTNDPMAVFARRIASPMAPDSPFANFVPKPPAETVPIAFVKTKPSSVSVTYENGKTVAVLPPMACILFMCYHGNLDSEYAFLNIVA